MKGSEVLRYKEVLCVEESLPLEKRRDSPAKVSQYFYWKILGVRNLVDIADLNMRQNLCRSAKNN